MVQEIIALSERRRKLLIEQQARIAQLQHSLADCTRQAGLVQQQAQKEVDKAKSEVALYRQAMSKVGKTEIVRLQQELAASQSKAEAAQEAAARQRKADKVGLESCWWTVWLCT